jgi:transcription initiation factor TFIID subunit 9B
MPQEVLPTTARAIALLLSSNPAIQDVHPAVLHQLLEFAHRYTHQVLSDALVYSEHAGRAGKLDLDDVMLAVQARVGWELGGRVPKEVSRRHQIPFIHSLNKASLQYVLALATQTNAIPLPSVPEVFGVRLPPPKDRLTSVDFDILPNKPPPGVKVYEEEITEETDDDDDDANADVDATGPRQGGEDEDEDEDEEMEEMDVTNTANEVPQGDDAAMDADALFEGDDDDDDGPPNITESASNHPPSTQDGGMKRMLVEDDDYD